MNHSFLDNQNTRMLITGVLVVLGLWLGAKFVTEVMNFSYIGRTAPAQNLISVQGEGEIFAKADIASVTYSVSEEKKTVEEAQKLATEKMDKALAGVKALGVDEKDIKTTNYSVYPQYDYKQAACTQWGCPPGEQVLKGYTVSQSIALKIRDTEKVGAVLEALGKAGITTISGPEFTIDDDLTLKEQARAQAIADAKERAQKLASELGVKLVRIVNYYESSDPGYPMPMYAMDAGMMKAESVSSRAPSIPTGENKIRSTVSITYEIR